MAVLGLALGALAAFLLLAYFQLPLIAWTIATALLGWGVCALAGFSLTTTVVFAAVFLFLAAILNIAFLRRILITNHILAVYRRILPDMSQTEK